MARFRKKQRGFGVRIRYADGRDEWFQLEIEHDNEPLARDRHRRLQRIANLLRDAGKHAEARVILEEAARERNEKAFRAVEVMVEGFSPESAKETEKPATFRKVVDLYTSGTLHELYPDDVPFKGPLSLDGSRTQLAVFLPLLGDKTFDQISKADIDEAKRSIPADSAGATRRQYIRELRRVMNFAVEPLRLVDHVVTVTVPKKQKGEGQIFTFLYPDEERMLSGCRDVPFELRFLYAFLARNGSRISETLQVTWDHVDLKTGAFHLDKAWTKTKRARYWTLEPDVLRALQLRRLERPDDTLIFGGPKGKPLTRQGVLQRFRPDLRRAGLSRPELFGRVDGVRGLTTHDLRATFVTLARRRGMPDQWIRDHTGHDSARTLEVYARLVRHADELHLGWFMGMALALGMVHVDARGSVLAPMPLAQTPGPVSGQSGKSFGQNPGSFRFSSTDPEAPSARGRAKFGSPEEPTPPSDALGPAEKSPLGQALAQTPPEPPSAATDSPADSIEAALIRIEEGLQRDLSVLIAAGRYELADKVMAELRERRLQRSAPAVTSLADARRKKDEGK